MPQVVTATDGDTLCSLARANGYENCQKLRACAANSAFLNRDLVAGDRVTIPDMSTMEVIRAVAKKHVFRAPGIPLPGMRVVKGLADATDPATGAALNFLNVSNFRADKAGTTGTQAFPTTFGFSAHADADPDVFKVEVWGVAAGTDTVNVTLEALKPAYPSAAVFTPNAWAPFPTTDANAGLRKVTVACKRMTSFPRLQSRYLRLVVDEGDMTALSGSPARTDGTAQALYVSDLADGNHGANDKVEILDQKVRASYEVVGCAASGTQQKCTIRRTLEIGPQRKRLKVCFHVYKTAVGGAVVGGLTDRMIRRRTNKWLRRIYAQAELAPKLVAPEIEFLDPPGANMLVIADVTGDQCSGVKAGGGRSSLQIDLSLPPPTPPPVPPARGPAPTPVRIDLDPGLNPIDVGNRLVAALPAPYQGTAFENATCLGQARGSCDVLITRTDGQRCLIRSTPCDDTVIGTKLTVPRINIALVASPAGFNDMPASNSEARRLIREAPGLPDQLDYYIIGTFVSTGTGAYALLPSTDWPAANTPKDPLKYAVIIACLSGGTANMDLTDDFFSMLPHEGGHALMDLFHTVNTDPLYTESLMYDFENSTDTPAVDKRKRLHSTPLTIQMQIPQNASPYWTTAAVDPTVRLRTRGASCCENW